MPILLFFTVPFIIGIPVLLIWMWHGRYLPKNCVGMRLENHRSQVWRASKQLLTICGIMLLLTVDEIIRAYSVSQAFHQFWRGFFAASDFFLTGILIVNTLPLWQEWREKRQHKLSADVTAKIN